MDEKRIKEVVEGIYVSNDIRNRILRGYRYKLNKRIHRKMIIKKTMKVSFCCILIMFLLLMPITSKENNFELKVYAAMADGTVGPVLLDDRSEILLQLQDTPVGMGYIFEVTLPDRYTFKSMPSEEKQPLFTVYQEGNNIYWIPDTQIAGNIYNNNSERIQPQTFNNEVKLCKFVISIYNPDSALEKNIPIEFRMDRNQCSVKFY